MQTAYSKKCINKDVRLTDKRVLRKALFIPDTLLLYDVLETFKTSGEDFAVVVNEYALVVGVVTLKDVMSIVMGELVNTEEEPQIIRRTEDTWLVDGATPLADVMRALDIVEFPNSENYETIAGFMMYSLRKIPKPWCCPTPKSCAKSTRATAKAPPTTRSEERRVGKECRSRWSP